MSRENEAGSRVTADRQVTVSLVDSHHFVWVRRGKEKSEGTVPPSTSMCDNKSRAGAQRDSDPSLFLSRSIQLVARNVDSQLPPLPGSFLRGCFVGNPEGNVCHLFPAH